MRGHRASRTKKKTLTISADDDGCSVDGYKGMTGDELLDALASITAAAVSTAVQIGEAAGLNGRAMGLSVMRRAAEMLADQELRVEEFRISTRTDSPPESPDDAKEDT